MNAVTRRFLPAEPGASVSRQDEAAVQEGEAGQMTLELGGAWAPAAPPQEWEELPGSFNGAAPARGPRDGEVQPHPSFAPGDPAGAGADAELTAPAATLGERIVRSAFALGVPANILVAPFRRPLRPRIKATVECPPLGDRVAGMALRAGHFLIGGVKIPFLEADFAASAKLPPLLDSTLHGFTWLRDLAASAPTPQCAAIAERVMRTWLAANPEPEAGPRGSGAWSVENAGRRLLAWLVHAPLILGGGDKAYRAAALEAIGETASWLDRRAGKAEDPHGEALAWAAITAAGLLLPEGKPRRLYGEAGLVHALAAMVCEEGGVLSRSPLAQCEAIAMLAELAACYRATRREPPPAVSAMLQMLVPPLLGLTQADGSLGNWQGAGAVRPERVAALVRASGATGARARPLREVRHWGYQRIAARAAVLVCDAGPPPLGRHARSGCASTLAFEFSHAGHALIVNCGGAALAGGQVPKSIEQGLRATAAHSTLVLGDANSTAVLIGGRLGKGVSKVEVDRSPVMLEEDAIGAGSLELALHRAGGPATRLDVSHDGYAARFGLMHRRVLTLADDGTTLVGEDRLEPSGRAGKRGKVSFAIRFHLGPLVDLRLLAPQSGLEGGGQGKESRAADLVLPDGGVWRFVVQSEALAAEESLWVDGDGRPHAVQQLVIEGLASRGGDAYCWSLRRMA